MSTFLYGVCCSVLIGFRNIACIPLVFTENRVKPRIKHSICEWAGLYSFSDHGIPCPLWEPSRWPAGAYDTMTGTCHLDLERSLRGSTSGLCEICVKATISRWHCPYFMSEWKLWSPEKISAMSSKVEWRRSRIVYEVLLENGHWIHPPWKWSLAGRDSEHALRLWRNYKLILWSCLWTLLSRICLPSYWCRRSLYYLVDTSRYIGESCTRGNTRPLLQTVWGAIQDLSGYLTGNFRYEQAIERLETKANYSHTKIETRGNDSLQDLLHS